MKYLKSDIQFSIYFKFYIVFDSAFSSIKIRFYLFRSKNYLRSKTDKELKIGSLKWQCEDNNNFSSWSKKAIYYISTSLPDSNIAGTWQHYTREMYDTEKAKHMCMKIQSFLFKIWFHIYWRRKCTYSTVNHLSWDTIKSLKQSLLITHFE